MTKRWSTAYLRQASCASADVSSVGVHWGKARPRVAGFHTAGSGQPFLHSKDCYLGCMGRRHTEAVLSMSAV